MALPALAQLIQKLTATPHASGLSNRKQFNQNPTADLAALSPTELEAFLQLRKGPISAQVLNDLIGADPTLRGNAEDIRDYVLWLYEYTRWDWDPNEDAEYPKGFTGPQGIVASYPDPVCQIEAVVVRKPYTAGGAADPLALEIYGEGFLPGRTVVEILADASGATVHRVQRDPEPGSTFRGGKIVVNPVALAAGSYRAVVKIALGNGWDFTIDSPVAHTRFSIT
ncbi:MAG: hypothetical protein KatS3mg077_1159 [Candidatus Binatia bacterium]|nr:MAG: hypothetical protein KatS3mg077_1159 [Candidatus Binatia bacterium]